MSLRAESAEDADIAEKAVPDITLEVEPLLGNFSARASSPAICKHARRRTGPASRSTESIRKEMVESGIETTHKPEAVHAKPLL